MPISSSILPAHSGPMIGLAPSAASRSALPQTPELDRFPCLATGTSQPATTNAEMVETLKVRNGAPPVPQRSATVRCLVCTFTDASANASANALICSGVSPLADNR